MDDPKPGGQPSFYVYRMPSTAHHGSGTVAGISRGICILLHSFAGVETGGINLICGRSPTIRTYPGQDWEGVWGKSVGGAAGGGHESRITRLERGKRESMRRRTTRTRHRGGIAKS